ncbi:MAG TPA: glycosyltransferase family 39 protein, partial [Gemmataceae bacterium]|nr:glycosyltransferase family 39 protein [Gemmataceae bacterium]
MPEPASTTSDNSSLLARQPLVWLLVIMALALGLRVSKINEPLQRDEFGALYAVAERKTSSAEVPPTATDPLAPVSGLGEVSDRSVLPFGVRNPVPLYHDILYFTVKVLPISEWSLRLPSLLAGLGCVLGVYLLCRRLVGLEMALIAALFVAVEPTQVTSSVLARPYALANLACVLSFAALLGLLKAGNPATAAPIAAGYAAAVAFVGYMNPVLLLVVVAH